MEGYRSFAVTVKGGSHIKSGTVCQDSSNFYDDENVSLAVVADGHGDSNCIRSDKGAKFAVSCATSGIQRFVKEQIIQSKKSEPPSHRELEKSIREKLIKQTVASWNSVVMDHHKNNPFTKQELENASEKYRKRYEKGESINKAYGTSLIAAAITPWYWFAYHIGDGRFSVLYQNGSGGQPVPWDPKCYLNVTTSICDDDILDRGEEGVRTFLSLHTDKEPPVAFFLCSDGIDDNYPVDEKENAIHLYRLYREIAVTFAEDGYDSTCGEDGKSGQIKDLANEFATKGKGDDTSLAGIVNIEELIKVAPEWKEKMAAYPY
jgi:serine/threonine protein phosphatase PrpC